jgi:hypothetical protein
MNYSCEVGGWTISGVQLNEIGASATRAARERERVLD